MGDFKAKVGREAVEGVAGAFGLGERNDRRNMLIQFCKQEGFVITCVLRYQLLNRHLYTWRSPRDSPERIVRNQIDFFLIKNRFQNNVTRVAAYPGADVGSVHNPIIANFRLNLKINSRKKTTHKKYNMQKLQQTDGKEGMKLKLGRIYNQK